MMNSAKSGVNLVILMAISFAISVKLASMHLSEQDLLIFFITASTSSWTLSIKSKTSQKTDVSSSAFGIPWMKVKSRPYSHLVHASISSSQMSQEYFTWTCTRGHVTLSWECRTTQHKILSSCVWWLQLLAVSLDASTISLVTPTSIWITLTRSRSNWLALLIHFLHSVSIPMWKTLRISNWKISSSSDMSMKRELRVPFPFEWKHLTFWKNRGKYLSCGFFYFKNFYATVNQNFTFPFSLSNVSERVSQSQLPSEISIINASSFKNSANSFTIFFISSLSDW